MNRTLRNALIALILFLLIHNIRACQERLHISEYEDGSFELFRAGKHIGSGCLDDQPCED